MRGPLSAPAIGIVCLTAVGARPQTRRLPAERPHEPLFDCRPTAAPGNALCNGFAQPFRENTYDSVPIDPANCGGPLVFDLAGSGERIVVRGSAPPAPNPAFLYDIPPHGNVVIGGCDCPLSHEPGRSSR